MYKKNLINLFNPGTQNHKIVQHILKQGHAYNFEFPGMGILSYTRRISEIRLELGYVLFDIVATRIENTGTYVYRIVKIKKTDLTDYLYQVA